MLPSSHHELSLNFRDRTQALRSVPGTNKRK